MKGFRLTVFLKKNANVESFPHEPMHGFLRHVWIFSGNEKSKFHRDLQHPF